MPARHVRGNRRSVDQHPDRDDQILVDGAIPVIQPLGVVADQHEIVGGRKLGDDRAPERALRVARPLPPSAIPAQCRDKTRGDQQQERGDDRREKVTH
jgi:hypothetical protein